MKTYGVKVGYFNSDRSKVLYSKYYRIEADTEEEAKRIVRNGLSMLEFYNFVVIEAKEVE